MEPRRGNQLEGVTQEEVSKLTKAMKDKEFKKYMDEYCKETSDPKNRKEYLQYLDQLEAKGEMPEGQTLLRTQPGCCVKTNILFKSGQTQKLFINIVHTDQLNDFSMDRSGDGHKVHLPYSLSPPRPDRDLKDQYCMTCDLAVSSRTFFQAGQNAQIFKMLVDTAADNLGRNFLNGFEEVKKDYKVMQRMQCKGGAPMPMSVKVDLLKDGGKNQPTPKNVNGDAVTPAELKRMKSDIKAKKQKEDDEEDAKARKAYEDRLAAEEKKRAAAKSAKEDAAPRIRVPQHRLVHSGSIVLTDYMESNSAPSTPVSTVPQLLKLIVELPTVKKSSDVSLEVTATNVVVEVDGKYYLDLPLPYEIDDGKGGAKFDKAKQTLTLELPVVPKPPDPEMIAAAARAMSGIIAEEDNDGALNERKGESSDEDLPPLEEVAAEPFVDATPPQETPPAQPPAPARRSEPLEIGEGAANGGALRIPAAAAAAESRPCPAVPTEGGKEAEEADGVVEAQEYPDFTPAQQFEGQRAGYAFKLGDEGLGYYRDLRQALPGRKSAAHRREIRFRAADPADEGEKSMSSSAGPLVTEVAPSSCSPAPVVSSGANVSTSAQPAAPAKCLPPLPAVLRRYVDESSLLRKHLSAAECEDGQVEELPRDLPLAWHQNRQNLVLLVDVQAGHEVADVQLVLVDRRLTLSFATRARCPTDDGTRLWRRHRLRRVLFSMADPRQWHVELPGSVEDISSPRQLVFVLRKVDQSKPWPEAFDASAVVTAWQDVATDPSSGSSAAIANAGATGTTNSEGGRENGEAARATSELRAAEADGEAIDGAKRGSAVPSGRVSASVGVPLRKKRFPKGAAAALLVYDVSRRDSFERCLRWVEDVKRYSGEHVPIMLIGNKTDLYRRVSSQEGAEFAFKHGLAFIETCAKTAENVDAAFLDTAKTILKRIQDGELDPAQESNGIRIGQPRPSIRVAVEDPFRLRGGTCCNV